jgi:hypothetical protein
MGLDEVVKHRLLLLLVGGGRAGSLLTLFELQDGDKGEEDKRTGGETLHVWRVGRESKARYHHLLYDVPGFVVEVRELGVLGLDLGGVDLGMALDDARPPFHLIHLLQLDEDRAALVCTPPMNYCYLGRETQY